MRQEQDELQVLQTIGSLSRTELEALVRAGEASGSTMALRDMFNFVKNEAEPLISELPG